MIRKFKESDFARIYELGLELSKDFKKVNNLEEIKNNNYTEILVYEENDRVLGFLMYIEVVNSIDIIDIIVDEAHRNKLIASSLLDYLITGISKNIKTITLEVRVSNSAAINLYTKFGFEKFNIRKAYYGDEDAYLMGKEIR